MWTLKERAYMFTWKTQWRSGCLPSKARVAPAGLVSSGKRGASGRTKPASVSLTRAALQWPKEDCGEGGWTFAHEQRSGDTSKETNF